MKYPSRFNGNIRRGQLKNIQLGLLFSLIWLMPLCRPCLLPAQGQEMKEALFDLLAKPQYKPAFKNLLAGHKGLPQWITLGRGVSSPCEKRTIGSGTFIVGSMCEPHNCGNHQFAVAFSADLKQAWGLRYIADDNPQIKPKREWFGNPNEELKKALESRLSL